jgi:hypothetical protein
LTQGRWKNSIFCAVVGGPRLIQVKAAAVCSSMA